jgi:hypothetical protein
MSGVWGLERCGVSGDMTLFGVRATCGTIQAVVPRIEAILPSAPRLGLDTSVGDSQAPLGRGDANCRLECPTTVGDSSVHTCSVGGRLFLPGIELYAVVWGTCASESSRLHPVSSRRCLFVSWSPGARPDA